MSNPIPNVPVQRLVQYQASHFAFMMRNRNAQNPQQPQPNPQQQQGILQGQMQNVFGQRPAFPNHPQPAIPSDQDIQRLRAQNPKLQSLSDDQVRQAIMNRQQQQMRQAMQNAQLAGRQPGTMAQAQALQTRQPQQAQQLPARTPSQATAQARPPPTPTEKGVKRPNEASKPNASGPPARAGMEPPKQFPQMTREQFNTLPPEKQAHYMKMQHMQRLVNIGKQVQSSAPKLQPIKMDPITRQRLVTKLSEESTKNMMTRFDQLLLAYWDIKQDETQVRGLILNKLHLFSQFEPASIQNKTWVPAQNLSMSPQRAEEILNDLSAKFHDVTKQIPKQQQPAQLTPENLSRLQEQEDRKKSVKGKDIPPAPTTTQPPFQFGDNRGHGTPQYAGPALKQEDLKLDPKRRKKNPPAAQTPAGQLSATPPTTSPQVSKTQPLAQLFRCSVPSCERNKQGFSSQVELDQHTNAVHKIDTEPVTDPLAFLDASLRDAFNLDENFKQIKKTPPPKAPPMEKTTSKTSVANLKAESKPATPSAMASVPSQTDAPRPQSGQLNKDDMGLKAQADDWEHTKITLEELNNIFGDMDWEEAVPAAALELQDKFIEQYQQSEEWQKLINTPIGSLMDTTTEKSTSPPDPANREPAGKTEETDVKDDPFVDVQFDDLELSDLGSLDNIHSSAPNGDVAMSDGNGSPFEMLDKPALTAEQQFLLDNDIDYSRPESLNAGQKKLMDFIIEPLVVSTDPILDDPPWQDIDWEGEAKQRQEDIRLGTPGAWNGRGFNRFP
jgi:hypothetical protein